MAAILLLVFVIALSSSSSSSARPIKKQQYKPCKQLVVYFHDTIYDGKNAANATSAIVAGPEGSNFSSIAPHFHFGNITVFDDPLTLDNNLRSKPVGRAQGVHIYETKNTFTAWLRFTICLNYSGGYGTINLVGADPTLMKTRDISITGGTSDFFMHRGVATLLTDTYEGNAYFRLHIDIKF